MQPVNTPQEDGERVGDLHVVLATHEELAFVRRREHTDGVCLNEVLHVCNGVLVCVTKEEKLICLISEVRREVALLDELFIAGVPLHLVRKPLALDDQLGKHPLPLIFLVASVLFHAA